MSGIQDMSASDSTPALLFVRVQDDLYGATTAEGGLRLPYKRNDQNGEARNTSHWSVNCIVSDHAYGRFNETADGAIKGKFVIVALPGEMPAPAGLGQVDTWFRMDASRKHDATLDRGLSVGRNATIVAPTGAEVPSGVRVIRYTGGIAERDAAVNGVIREAGIRVEQSAMRGWAGGGNSDAWAESIAREYYAGRAAEIHCGTHAGSADDAIECEARIHALIETFGSNRLYERMDGVQVPMADVIRDEIADNREVLSKLIASMSPTERLRVGPFYEDRLASLDRLQERTNAIERSWTSSAPPPLPGSPGPVNPPPLPPPAQHLKAWRAALLPDKEPQIGDAAADGLTGDAPPAAHANVRTELFMTKVQEFQQRVAAKQVAAAGATLDQDVLDAAMTASRNAVDYLTGKLSDARLIQSERERIAGAIQSLEALRNTDPQGLFSVGLKGAHDVVNSLFATPTTMEGRPGVGIVNDLRVAMTAVEHGVEAASSHLPIKRREIVTYVSTVLAAGVFVSRSDGATLLLERGLPQSYRDELAKAKKAGRSTEYVFEDLFRFHHALGVESQPPKISESLFHVTTRRNLGAIASEGLRAKSYWAEAGDVVGYYEQVVRDEGDESVTLAVRIWDLHEAGLAPDKPGIDEPITSAIGKSESEVHALWEASRGTWRNSLKIVGSARYDLPVPSAALYAVGRDSRLVPLAEFAAESTHEHTPSAPARRPRM